MTTPKDDYTKRIQSGSWGEGREATVGVTTDGFIDPSGEFPKREHYHGSNVSKAARGVSGVRLPRQGSVSGLDLSGVEKPLAVSPYNQVKETPSGHIIEINDTPGAEGLVVKHRSGSGVEFRPDGSLVVSSRSNRIEVTAGEHAVIVEGDGQLIYHGNLTLTVSGDYNVNVGGAYNLNVTGDKVEDVVGASRRRCGKTSSEVVLGDKDTKVVGHRASLCLQDDFQAVKGAFSQNVQGNVEFCTAGALAMAAGTEFSLVGMSGIISANVLSVVMSTGVVGGEDVKHVGNVYSGPAEGTGSLTTFYGNLVGIASEALTAKYAQRAAKAYSSQQAILATSAILAYGTTGAAAPTPPVANDMLVLPLYKMNSVWHTDPPSLQPNGPIIGSILGRSSVGIRNVQIDPDDGLLNALTRINDYAGKLDRTPTTAEVRSLLRDEEHLSDPVLTSQLLAEGRLNPAYNRVTPEALRRVAGKEPTPQFGSTLIGNTPPENRSKRFTT
jgi:hypothetical protein